MGRNRNLYNIKSTIPCGKSGNWAIEKFNVSKDDAKGFNLRASFANHLNRPIQPGIYTKLTYNNSTIMSDTPAEIQDCIRFMYKARGSVLVNGLGLGVVIEGLILNAAVKCITIIEKSPAVISLVAKHLTNKNKNITIIEADAFKWKSPKGLIYDSVWHDIWPNICGDYWESIKKLHRKYARRCKYQDSWCRNEIKRLAI